jgi:RND family efflux transporter MFP subunit
MKKKIIINLLKIAAIALLLYFGISGFIKSRDQSILVRQVKPEDRVVKRTVSAAGKISGAFETDLSFQATQKISSLNVGEGDTVVKGDLLAVLDASAYYSSIQSAKDSRDIAQRQLEVFIDRKTDNINTLGGRKAYDITLRQYEESLSKYEALYQQALQGLSSYRIYAPFDGTVIDVLKETGETAATGESVIKIADLDSLVFETKVDQEDFGLIKLGQKVEINLDTYPGVVFQATVSKLPFYSSSTDGAFEISADIQPQESYQILLGMTGDAHIILQDSGSSVLSLNYTEVYYDNETPYLWVVRDGRLFKKNIQIGIEGDIYIELKESIDFPIVVPVKEDTKMIEGYSVKLIK